MISFILNDETISTDLPKGMTVLDFVRYRKNLKGTKIGCREGDCGACTVLVGELRNGSVRYRSMTSCLMPLANATGKHIVTVEGINPPDGGLTPVQAALVEESGSQCGFCTVGFVMSLTGFCIDDSPKTVESAVSAIDGNICRCTGYKSIERTASRLQPTADGLKESDSRVQAAIQCGLIPDYFSGIAERLTSLPIPQSAIRNSRFVGGGTDLYVQRPDEMTSTDAASLFDEQALRFIRETDETVEAGASTVVTDLLESPVFQRIFPKLREHLKLVSSTPIRNMATLAGNFVNASPIGDMTVWFLALDAAVVLDTQRELPLKDLYLGYKRLAMAEDEIVTSIRFKKGFTHFNFEKVCKRTYLDIASVNTAISLSVRNGLIERANVSAGGVAPIPLYLGRTSAFLIGKPVDERTVMLAADVIATEISPISDVRGSAEYKSLLLKQLFRAHFFELFGI